MAHRPSTQRVRRGHARLLRSAVARGSAVGAALLAALVHASAAHADPGPVSEGFEPIRVRVEAHAGCPGEMSFVEQVRARTLKARPAAEDERARSFVVTVVQDGAVNRGRLTVEELDGSSSVRAVSGDTCDEVVAAMALITALMIDPEQAYRERAPEPLTPPPPTPLPGAPPAIIGAQPAVQYSMPAGGWLDPQRAAPYLPPASPWTALAMPLPVLLPEGAEQPGDGVRVSAGVHGAATSAASPGLLPSISLFIDVGYRAGGLVSPSVRLWLSRAEGRSVDTGAGVASFQLTEARLDVCPLALPLLDAAALTPCALIEAGALQAEGQGLVSAESRTRPWVAAGVLGRLHLDISDVLRIEAQGGATFPLVRDTFVFEPDVTVHDVPAVGGFFGGGAGLYFP